MTAMQSNGGAALWPSSMDAVRSHCELPPRVRRDSASAVHSINVLMSDPRWRICVGSSMVARRSEEGVNVDNGDYAAIDGVWRGLQCSTADIFLITDLPK